MRRAGLIGLGVALFVGVLFPAGSSGASPSVTALVNIEPAGTIFKHSLSQVSVSLDSEITPEPGSLTLKPPTNVRLSFPNRLTFTPDERVTPVCPISKIGPGNANFSTDAALTLCGNSVVGNGDADLFLAQFVGVRATDPKIVAFNGGRDQSGNPVINLHAYSPSLNQGIFMTGTLRDGIFDIAIPRLPADSSVPRFHIEIPGELGRDPAYARASCPDGKWVVNTVTTIANRSDTGRVSESEELKSPTTVQPCEGKAEPRARLNLLKVRGPRSVNLGRRAVYHVKVGNPGASVTGKVKLAASGRGAKGKAVASAIGAGMSRTVKVRVKFARKGKIKLKFKASGKNVKLGTARIKVRVR